MIWNHSRPNTYNILEIVCQNYSFKTAEITTNQLGSQNKNKMSDIFTFRS